MLEDMFADILNGEIRPDSPRVRPPENAHRNGSSPDSPLSPGLPVAAPGDALTWPADLDALLRRVGTAFEWTDADRRDFIAWASRSPAGLADAGLFLQTEIEKLEGAGGGSNL